MTLNEYISILEKERLESIEFYANSWGLSQADTIKLLKEIILLDKVINDLKDLESE